MTRHQRMGMGVAAAGLGLSIIAVVVLQIDPSRMLVVHEVLHRTGLAVMLVGLTQFLTVSMANRHGERLRTALRAALAMPRLLQASPESARIVQEVGSALMAVAIAGEAIISLIPGGETSRGATLLLAGIPGMMIWLAGSGVALLARSAERARRASPPRTWVRATPAFREWSESAPETSSAE